MRKVVLLLASLLTWIGCAFGQQRTVTGVVTSAEDGEPLIQLTVQVKGTQTGVATDTNGRYSVRVPNSEAVLVFTYTGYTTQEIKVGDQSTINVVMQMANEEIDEVMVVAFGKAKKSTFTGSAASVSSKELERKQVSNVVNALSGKVPGVAIASTDNQPGMSATVQIRGLGSFSAGRGPLYVVDGVPFEGDVSSINPNDVESTVLLKDAASAALYGARAANGVVMITTKSGANARNEGMMNVNVTAKAGYNFRGIPAYDRINDPKKYLETYYEAVWNTIREANDGETLEAIDEKTSSEFLKETYGPGYIPFTFPDNITNADHFKRNADGTFSMHKDATLGLMHTNVDDRQWWEQPDDWAAEAIKPNMRQEYTVNLSGRSDKANYFFSSGYLNDKGYVVGSDFTRYSTRLRGDYRPKKWLHMGGNISYSHTVSNALGRTTDDATSGNIFNFIDFIAPIYPVYVRDSLKRIKRHPVTGHKIYDYGKLQFPNRTRPYLGNSNPLQTNQYELNEDASHVLGMRSYVDFIIPYGFRLTFNIGYDLDDTYSTGSTTPFYGQSATYGGAVEKSFSRLGSMNVQQLLNWNQAYGENHIDVLLGHEYYDRLSDGLTAAKRNLFHYKARELSGAIGKPEANSARSRYRVEGFLGRAQYDWAEKYFVSLSFRCDGSSRFAKDRRWGNFYSAGVSWLISSEDFMVSTRDFLDLLKLKFSYGQQGNDNIGDFRYTDLYDINNQNDEFGTAFSSKGNPNITWETSTNINAGIEFAFFRHRLTGSVEVFKRKVTDMLFNITVPPSAGYSSYLDNVGSMSNYGLEFELRGIPYRDRNVQWSVNVNGGVVRNRIDKLPNEWKQDKYGYITGIKSFREGESYHNYFMPKYVGVGKDGEALWQTYDTVTKKYSTTKDYNVALQKQNRVFFGDIQHKLRGGFGTDVEFFGFDFGASFSYQIGGRGIDYSYLDLMHGGYSRGAAMHVDALKSWRASKHTNIPQLSATRESQNGTSDRFTISNSYLAIDNMTLGYTFKKEWLDKIGVGSLRVYAVADNIWLFSARKGYDPRFGGGRGYKIVRTISGGVNLTF